MSYIIGLIMPFIEKIIPNLNRILITVLILFVAVSSLYYGIINVKLSKTKAENSSLHQTVKELQNHNDNLAVTIERNKQYLNKYQSLLADIQRNEQGAVDAKETLTDPKHDLTELSRAKPQLIENRINKAISDFTKSVEDITHE